jgi:hypothetical protein
MTRIKWAAAALLLGAAALLGRSARTTEAAPVGKVGDSPKVKALLKERRDELRAAFKPVRRDLLAGRITLRGALEVSRQLLQAELEAAEKPADRVVALQAHSKVARDMETRIEAAFKAGTCSVTDLHLTRATRLEVEIALLRAGGKVPAGK